MKSKKLRLIEFKLIFQPTFMNGSIVLMKRNFPEKIKQALSENKAWYIHQTEGGKMFIKNGYHSKALIYVITQTPYELGDSFRVNLSENKMSIQEFAQYYQPLNWSEGHDDDVNWLIECNKSDRTKQQDVALDDQYNIWTWIEEDSSFYRPGQYFVNRLMYIVTSVPFCTLDYQISYVDIK